MNPSQNQSAPSTTVSNHDSKDPIRSSSGSGRSNPFSNEDVSQKSSGASTTLFSADHANPFEPIPSPAPSPPPSPIRSVPSALPFQADLPTDPSEIEAEYLNIACELHQYEWNTDKAVAVVEDILRAQRREGKERDPNTPTEGDYRGAVTQMATLNRYCQRIRARLFELKDYLPESSYLREATWPELQVLAHLHVDAKGTFSLKLPRD